MIIAVGHDDRITLEDAMNFRGFKVSVPWTARDTARLARAFTGIGQVDGADHVWIDQTALNALGPKDDPAWRDGVSGMIHFAEKHGWVEPGSGAVRAHIEWTAA
ncbi:MAG: hypothetical protein KF735_02620 [Chelatococcus sp.]|jgi:hypothetical protein|uniref:hypothetical protein n=1 Tax=unclassified Chelatococcus TaxID=2638111 RepID=UPI001BD07D36|nr:MULTISPECIES: hypothetical protein [unclassified Chelatococcus]CAH1668629.1 conserved hypothetical protein [Hyphomicrobiales bacterium]MBS7739432.1 hypothetical protein [Chelatococcus sp. HY11]MBX3536508.1 hypothetical protein [Chelatococcus sp.]MBX3543801.1 hypothetical protein [Chelatococcus sp.]MCO5076032.1 hypothetical protein [Chelatococcus sp.]